MTPTAAINNEGIAVPFHDRAFIGRQEGENFAMTKSVRCRGPFDILPMRIPHRPFDSIQGHARKRPGGQRQIYFCFRLAGEINETPERIALALDILPPFIYAASVRL